MSAANVNREAQIRELQRQLVGARTEHKEAMQNQIAAQRRTGDAERAVNRIVNQIAKLEQDIKADSLGEPIVTEHAILRWLERHHGLNIENVRQEILGEGTAAKIKFVNTGKIVKDNLSLIVKDRTVITVAPINKGQITL